MKKNPVREKNEYWTYGDLTEPIEIGLYYGFTPTQPLKIEKQDFDRAKHIVKTSDEETLEELSVHPEELFALLRIYFQKTPPPLPVMTIRSQHPKRKDRKKEEYCLDIVGSQRSIADATVIKTSFEIAREQGYEDLIIEINSVGDRDSFARFSRELTSYFRKHINELHPDCRHALKKSPFAALKMCDHEKCIPIKEHAPHPINYLSEPSRIHFQEVLEFLEMSELPYTINNNLIENPEFVMHTVFTILGREKHEKDLKRIGHGTRWGGLAKKLGFKKDVQGVTATVVTNPHSAKTKKIKKPQFYFIQMGQEAKLRSLFLIEILRRAKIPLYHSLTKDKFAAQLSSAENVRVPYVLIMGQKESIEHTVLVRDMNNRSQDTIRIDQVADYLKKLI